MRQIPEKVGFSAKGARLTGYYYPAQGRVRANLVLHGATGVPQQFYRHFATWATENGIGVLTYDYRDFGESRVQHPRQSTATFSDWAVLDQDAAQIFLSELCPGGPLWVLGHSLGGLGVPFHNYNSRTARIITVGAGMVHYRDHPWSYLPAVVAFWFILGPLAKWIAGYLPGKKLMLGADLPAGVYWQWRRWCTRRDFFNGDIGASLPAANYAIDGPRLRIVVANDDVVCPPAAVRRYAAAFPSNSAEYVEYVPADYGLASLKHIDFFRSGNHPVWSHLLD